jgi:hypothetical protein
MFAIVQDLEDDRSYYWYGGEQWGLDIERGAQFGSLDLATETIDLIRKATGELLAQAEVIELFS